jgi:hypothetical protein
MREELTRRMAGDPARQIEVYQRIKAFERRLEEKYGDFVKYRAYHWFVGSTPPDDCDKEDFEGEDSVEEFFKGFLQERENPSSQ